MSNKLSKTYKVVGTDREELKKQIEDMDERTTMIHVNEPYEITIYAVLQHHVGEQSPRLLRLDVSTVNLSAFTSDPDNKKGALFEKKGMMGFLNQKSEAFQNLRPYFDDMDKIGFYLSINGERKVVITPSKRLLSTLCRRLNAGTVNPEINPFAYMYLTTTLRKAEPFSIIARRESDDSYCYKGYLCISQNYTYVKQEILWDAEKILYELEPHTLVSWSITNDVTKADYIFPKWSIRAGEQTIFFGIRCMVSSFSSIAIQPFVRYQTGTVLLSDPLFLTHRFASNNFSKLFQNLAEKAYQILFETRQAYQQRVMQSGRKVLDNQKTILKCAMTKDLYKIGKKRIDRIIDLCPEKGEYAQFLFWVLQLSGTYPEDLSDDVSAKIERTLGNTFLLLLHNELGEEDAC